MKRFIVVKLLRCVAAEHPFVSRATPLKRRAQGGPGAHTIAAVRALKEQAVATARRGEGAPPARAPSLASALGRSPAVQQDLAQQLEGQPLGDVAVRTRRVMHQQRLVRLEHLAGKSKSKYKSCVHSK